MSCLSSGFLRQDEVEHNDRAARAVPAAEGCGCGRFCRGVCLTCAGRLALGGAIVADLMGSRLDRSGGVFFKSKTERIFFEFKVGTTCLEALPSAF